MNPGELRSQLETEARAAGLELSAATLDRLAEHYRLLVKWNHAVRLVGSTEPGTVLRRHILESLALLPYIHEPRGSLLDIGSGNGYPAIPIKCALPGLRLGMVEPTIRKAAFLNAVIRELDLRDASVVRGRIDRPEDLARLGRWDCISMRAVAAIATVLAGAAAALRPRGRILLMLGETGRDEVLRRLPDALEIQADHLLPGTRGSFILAAGLRHATTPTTIH